MTKDNQNVKHQDFEIRQIDAMKRAHEMERRALNERQERELEMLERRLSSPSLAKASIDKKSRTKRGQMLN